MKQINMQKYETKKYETTKYETKKNMKQKKMKQINQNVQVRTIVRKTVPVITQLEHINVIVSKVCLLLFY